tara:strand:+ start:854 stop:1417 length:564 start_codon:yes stop_codon:yes gene_type:complete
MSLPSILVFDDFYSNPMEVRDFALKNISLHNKFSPNGYPGKRTINYYTEDLENKFKQIFSPYFSHVSSAPNSMCGSFQITNSKNKSWIHKDSEFIKNSDSDKNYAAVLFLTPNPPAKSGTTFYENINIKDSITETQKTEYKETDYVENKFNRIVIFNSSIFHASKNYFGVNDVDSRLTQVFFFSCFY